MKNILFLILLLVLVGCTKTENEPEGNLPTEEYASDFNFVFNYGVLKKNQLDTYNNTYTKDLVIDGSKTIEMKLTPAEKEKIYMYMNEIKLFDYPDEIEGMRIEPESGYEFEITYNGKEKKITWIGWFKNTQRDIEFKELVELIIDIIKSKDEYQELPEANGSYQ